MRALAPLLIAALLTGGCFWRWWGGGDPSEAAGGVDDPNAAGFAQRASGFYAQLESLPLVSSLTYETPALQNYFRERAAYNDYFASLATQVRRAQLRDRQVERIEVTEFRLVQPDEAVVDVTLVGRHERRLRFWEIELLRRDTWRRVDGSWLLTPDRL